MNTATLDGLVVPADRMATLPPERRGLARDEVALLVARPDHVTHTRFRSLGDHLLPGDVVVVNTSATRAGAFDATWRSRAVVLHLSTRRDDATWIVELRRPDGAGPVLDAAPGDVLDLPGGATATLLAPDAAGPGGGTRLWCAALALPPGHVTGWASRHGRPITYGDAPQLPLEDYQTVFARHPGSAEMASAGRPFSARLVTDLVARGVEVAPVTLHAGVSSQELGEPPRPEWADVPAGTAARVERARRAGRRVVAVGTTVTRALESAVDRRGRVRRFRGWTDLVLEPRRPVVAVGGLVTGWHEPGASHLQLLEAVAGRELVDRAYREALAGPYLWHEFGDSALFLP